ncbi:hypothetical protein RJ639_025980 [Escallonia herrerae]|uniref:Glycosyltransferase family 92 protein n=1 Tax=Escallonia herrerae TaxID=1293975 RepID=A0AA89ACT3_9ASTE|nr:hypothetical protein RJ639_025980 [Escallonia herrerae]
MGKERERSEKDPKEHKKMFIGVVWNCAAELKLLLTALLFLLSLITVFQFVPSRLSFSVSDVRHCISTTTAAAADTNISVDPAAVALSANSTPPERPLASPSPPSKLQDEVGDGGVIKRAFNAYGSAAYNYILMSAYRGGADTFAVMGLASKPLLVFGKPSYQCQWVPRLKNGSYSNRPVTASSYQVLPDWGYGRVYTVIVVNCTFPFPVGHDGSGGKLLLLATTNGGGDEKVNLTDTVEALTEAPATVNLARFTGPPKYDYLYCGSPLFGNLSPQRVREWFAFHVRLFGEKSHFVIYDAGGIHEGVREVLRAWMDKGYVTLYDVREQERFDGYYHNQFMVVNDCLHRYRFDAKWMFFFDLDEFIFVPKKSTLKSVLDSLSEYTQFTIEQMPMSSKLCLAEDAGKSYRKWGFEKLVYKDSKRGIRRDRKYAVQPRSVFATGVHMSQNAAGKTTHKTEGRIMYYHYHGTISERREPCRRLVNSTELKLDGIQYVVDTTMREAAGSVKRFELRMIGSRLQRTRQ